MKVENAPNMLCWVATAEKRQPICLVEETGLGLCVEVYRGKRGQIKRVDVFDGQKLVASIKRPK